MEQERKSMLTARQAASCENAKSPASQCKCRCGGAAHGKARGAVRDLDASDPHHPDDESPKERKRRERDEASRKRMEAFSKLASPVEPGELSAGSTNSGPAADGGDPDGR